MKQSKAPKTKKRVRATFTYDMNSGMTDNPVVSLKPKEGKPKKKAVVPTASETLDAANLQQKIDRAPIHEFEAGEKKKSKL